ncbi:MAG TPA: WhiB family transcriptional regulator [Verrucomicrobiales bacterium]|nr:WhiB family transcriptional regulator [Verrucomicrobiales bacterium]
MDDETLGGSGEVVNWKDEANCKGRGYLMFPKKHKDITYISEARRICRACSVRPECLAYALDFPAADMHGVWAGLTPRQLAKEQKARGVIPTKPTLAEFMADMLRYYKEQPTVRNEREDGRKESY